MDSISSLKRLSNDSLSMCIICQEHKKSEKLVKGGTQGVQRIEECANQRHKLKDLRNREIIDRVINVSALQELPTWHRSCYSWFTDKSKIARLEPTTYEPVQPSCHSSSAGPSTLRSSSTPINWKLCLFCQKDAKQVLHSVTSFNMSKKIMDAAKFDQVLCIALANSIDLMAAEGKYHLTC